MSKYQRTRRNCDLAETWEVGASGGWGGQEQTIPDEIVREITRHRLERVWVCVGGPGERLLRSLCVK